MANKEENCVEEELKNENDPDECKYCGDNPCCFIELKPHLMSMLLIHGETKTNNQMRYYMYTEMTKFIHGPGLGKGVRRKLPHCMEQAIKSLAPDKDKKYTGFKEAKCSE